MCESQNDLYVNNIKGTAYFNFNSVLKKRTFKMDPGAFVFAKIGKEAYA